jgi:Protein of unknown function (DUF1573)
MNRLIQPPGILLPRQGSSSRRTGFLARSDGLGSPSYVTFFRAGVILLLLPLAAPTPAQAELQCPQPTVQVGEVRGGLPLAQVFHFRNTGTTPIDITDVRPSCGCLRPRLDRRSILPGEEGAVLMEVNTLTQPDGLRQWRVTLGYRDNGQDRELSLSVLATVVSELLLEPAAVVLSAETACGHDLTLTEKRPLPLTITAVQTTRPELVVRLGQPVQAKDRTWTRTIQVEATEAFPEGRHEEMIQLFSNDAEFRELKIPVSIIKRSHQRVQALPGEVSLVGKADQPLPSRLVVLSGADDQEVVVEGVEAGDPAIRCQWARGPGKRSTLKIVIDPDQVHSGSLSSAVKVLLSKPAGEQVTIPVRCLLD